jgi:hypothetical protein
VQKGGSYSGSQIKLVWTLCVLPCSTLSKKNALASSAPSGGRLTAPWLGGGIGTLVVIVVIGGGGGVSLSSSKNKEDSVGGSGLKAHKGENGGLKQSEGGVKRRVSILPGGCQRVV